MGWRKGIVVIGLAMMVCGLLVGEDLYLEIDMEMTGMPAMPGMGGQPGAGGGGGMPMKQKVWVSGDKMRIEISGGPMPMPVKKILRGDLKKSYMIVDAMRGYMETPAGQGMGMIGGAGQGDPQVAVKKTGKSRRIGRWNCEEYVITMTGATPMTINAWVTKDVDVDSDILKDLDEAFGSDPGMKALREKTKDLGFPIETKVKLTMMGQPMTQKMMVTTVRKGPVPASMFELPAGYQKMNVPAMPPGGTMPPGGAQRP